jgi:hypothetical protein
MNGHFLKLHFYMFEKSQGKHNSLNYHFFWVIIFINCKVYMFKAYTYKKCFYMFKALKPQKWTIFIFVKHFFPTKCAPFLPKIGEDVDIDDYKRKGLELMKIVYITNLSTFGSNVFLTLQIMDFENVTLT